MYNSEFSMVPPLAGLDDPVAKARTFVEASTTESTRKSMRSSWQDVEAWVRQHGFASLITAPSPEVIALYLADRASFLSPKTLTKRLCCITQALRASGFNGPSPASTRQPLVHAVLQGIRRTKGVAPGNHRKDPLLTEQVRQLVSTCGDDLPGIRDRALILFDYAAGGLRRANLVATTVESLEFCEAGVIHHQGRSKADQEGVGRIIRIPRGSDPKTCPLRALRRLLDALGESAITSGPIFRAVHRRGGRHVMTGCGLSPASATYIVKRRVRLAGLPAEAYGSHSLRSGFCSQAALKVGDRLIMNQSGHKTPKSLDPYVRLSRVFTENAADSLGL